MRFVPERRIARTHAEAYDLWASEFDDPSLMANRDAETTRHKLARVATELPLRADSRVLDVGPGDGALFREIAGRVACCRGVDPSHAAVEKLTRLFSDAPNVSFELGRADALRIPSDAFDIVVINSVLQMSSDLAEVERALGEMVRVCRPGGLIFVGELPFLDEMADGILAKLGRSCRAYGARNFVRTLVYTYVRPLLHGEPIILYPAVNLHVDEQKMREFGERLGVTVECRRHHEMARPSPTRNDYWLRP
jgi:ubiquinone/menaquinone biosynthesis C-methylase UbiE